MPRVPYKPSDIAEPEDLVTSIRARRGGTLLNLDRMLLHSPPFANGWNTLAREVRTNLTLPSIFRELAMCVVAVLNRAEYEFHHHAPELVKAGGSVAQVEALRRLGSPGWDASLFGTAELAVIQLAVEMTRNVQVSDTTFSAVRSALADDQQVVELVGTIATYNMVSRFLEALKIEPE